MKDAALREIEKCVRCGGCKAVCPTHAVTGMEADSARGRMVMLEGRAKGKLKPTALLNERIYSCTLCGVCEQACPVGAKVTDAIYEGRRSMSGDDSQRRFTRAGMRFALKRPRLSFRTAKLLFPVAPGLLRRLTGPYSLSLPDEPLRSGPSIYKPRGKSRGRVAVFTGCSVNYLYPDLGRTLIHVLLHQGYEVVLPPGEVCCGEPLRALGLQDEAVKMAQRNMDVFSKLRAEAVVSLCPTCTLAIKVHYSGMLGKGLEAAQDATEFLLDKIEPRTPPAEGTVSYHNPCHLGALGVRKEPLKILRALGHEPVTPDEQDPCCGFSVGLWDKQMSDGLLERSLKGILDSDTLVTACPGCMMQFERRHRDVRHIIEVIEEAVCEAEASPNTAAHTAAAG